MLTPKLSYLEKKGELINPLIRIKFNYMIDKEKSNYKLALN